MTQSEQNFGELKVFSRVDANFPACNAEMKGSLFPAGSTKTSTGWMEEALKSPMDARRRTAASLNVINAEYLIRPRFLAKTLQGTGGD